MDKRYLFGAVGLLLTLNGSRAAAADYHVALDGDDNQAGTIDQPETAAALST